LLAVHEVLANAIEHAVDPEPATITVMAMYGDGMVEVVVRDHGRWRATEPSEERGRGLGLAAALSDTLDIDCSASGTRATLRWGFPPAPKARLARQP
jgi:anti-sigma regulatory factor (Ser/Thr protein kinase)